MTDATITCPNCATEIPLNESLAGPIIAETRKQFEAKLRAKDDEIVERELGIQDRERGLADERKRLNDKVQSLVDAQMSSERQRIVEEESNKAQQLAANEIKNKSATIDELTEILKSRELKLAEAQESQASTLKKQRELDDAMRELNLTVEKKVQDGIAEVRETTKREVDESYKLKVAEKDLMLASMQQKIEELKQKAEQGSQQLQGEVQELEIEALLRAKFPFDNIAPVPKGEFGGDALHTVINPAGQNCGTIIWETKRTRNWSDAWLTKLRDDQRSAKADMCILVTQALPKGIASFDVVEGVWVTSVSAALSVAAALRHTLLEVNSARQVSEGLQTKSEMVYQYLTGARFKQRVEAIVEAFSSMQDDLDKERKVITKQWAKRQEQIDRVMTGTVGMCLVLKSVYTVDLRWMVLRRPAERLVVESAG